MLYSFYHDILKCMNYSMKAKIYVSTSDNYDETQIKYDARIAILHAIELINIDVKMDEKNEGIEIGAMFNGKMTEHGEIIMMSNNENYPSVEHVYIIIETTKDNNDNKRKWTYGEDYTIKKIKLGE